MINVLKSLFVWLCFIPAAILNGGFRQHVLAEYMGNACAMALSGVLLSLFILLISCFLLPRVVKLSRKGCLIIGGLWMILTVVFEVVFSMSAGLFVQRYACYIQSYDRQSVAVGGSDNIFCSVICI